MFVISLSANAAPRPFDPNAVTPPASAVIDEVSLAVMSTLPSAVTVAPELWASVVLPIEFSEMEAAACVPLDFESPIVTASSVAAEVAVA